MAIARSKAKSLCTITELALVDASSPKSIGQLSSAQLRQKVSRARKLVDKWRGQTESQRRIAKSKPVSRSTLPAGRSAEKAQLFAEVLKRFETQLAKTEDQSTTVSVARKESPRKVRNRQHRATRASVRGDLAQSRLELSAKKKTNRRKPAKAVSAANASVAKEAGATAPAKPLTKRSRASRTPAASAKTPATTTRESQAIVPVGKQRQATTHAKQNRLQAAGIKRIQKHASARNKRNQAKRDSR